ncbi:MAG: hypothetical protein AAGC60_26620 [Acidobacteriota bacterium]
MLKKALLILLSVLLAFSLLQPLAEGGSPFDLGLDLSGGVRVTYRPDFDRVPDRLAELPRAELLAMAKETLSGRLVHRFDTLPDVVVRDDSKIVVSLPGEHDQRQVLETLGETYRLTFRRALAVHDVRPDASTADEATLIRSYEGRWLELGAELLDGSQLDPRSIRVLSPAQDSFDNLGQGATIGFAFRPPFDESFAEITRDSIGGTLAILLDDRVEWAGRVEQEIRGDGVLRGGYTVDEATEVAGLLRAGQLPVSLAVEGLSAVGPTLGQEVLDSGRAALLWSAGLLALVLLLAYGHRPALLLTGWVSLASLLFFTLGMIAALGLTVDLVAIAGLVLSIGMGMDAFILVFEALERRGLGGRPAEIARSPLGRVRQIYGFRGEGRTLVHANATTLLVVMLLFLPDRLQSFATFLVVGLVASLLTLLVTHGLLTSCARQKWLEDTGRPSLLGFVRRARPGVFRLRHLYLTGLVVFLVGSALTLDARGGSWLQLGSDFRPGLEMHVELPRGGEIEPLVADWQNRHPGLEARYRTFEPGTTEVGADAPNYLVTLEGEPWQGSESAETIAALAADLGARGATLREMSSVDARLSAERMLSSLSVLLLSFLLLGFYLRFVQHRIDGWLSPRARIHKAGGRIFVGTVLAVVLDVAVVLTALALLSVPLGLPVIAALLTIVGYSVNDSMVLWSHLSRPGRSSDDGGITQRINEGVDRILSRAVLTSLSTLAPAVVVLAIGLEPLRGFAWAVVFGTIAGTLSSLFVVASFAAPASIGQRRSNLQAPGQNPGPLPWRKQI